MQIRPLHWGSFNDLTHGGSEHVKRRCTQEAIEPNYPEAELIALVEFGIEVRIRIGAALLALMNDEIAMEQLNEKAKNLRIVPGVRAELHKQPRSPLNSTLGIMKLLRHIGRIVLLFGVSFVALAIFGVVYFWFFVPDMCANEVISESSSPDGGKRLVVFQRDCGATTGFSTQVSVLVSNMHLPNKEGNLYVSDTNHGAAPNGPGGGPSLKVTWVNSQSVVLTHHPKARLFKSETEAGGVRASYVAAE